MRFLFLFTLFCLFACSPSVIATEKDGFVMVEAESYLTALVDFKVAGKQYVECLEVNFSGKICILLTSSRRSLKLSASC